MILKLILSLASFSFPSMFHTKRTVHVRSHTRNGRRVKAHERTITAAPETDPYSYLNDNHTAPAFYSGEVEEWENEHIKQRRWREHMRLPPGAKVTHAPRFKTEYYDGNSWATVDTDGSIDISEIIYKRKSG